MAEIVLHFAKGGDHYIAPFKLVEGLEHVAQARIAAYQPLAGYERIIDPPGPDYMWTETGWQPRPTPEPAPDPLQAALARIEALETRLAEQTD